MSVYSLFNAHALISFVQCYLNMNKLELNPIKPDSQLRSPLSRVTMS